MCLLAYLSQIYRARWIYIIPGAPSSMIFLGFLAFQAFKVFQAFWFISQRPPAPTHPRRLQPQHHLFYAPCLRFSVSNCRRYMPSDLRIALIETVAPWALRPTRLTRPMKSSSDQVAVANGDMAKRPLVFIPMKISNHMCTFGLNRKSLRPWDFAMDASWQYPTLAHRVNQMYRGQLSQINLVSFSVS